MANDTVRTHANIPGLPPLVYESWLTRIKKNFADRIGRECSSNTWRTSAHLLFRRWSQPYRRMAWEQLSPCGVDNSDWRCMGKLSSRFWGRCSSFTSCTGSLAPKILVYAPRHTYQSVAQDVCDKITNICWHLPTLGLVASMGGLKLEMFINA